MVYDNSTKNKAIKLRKEGKTYSEILSIIPVAKSTLSEWFREVSLSKRQNQVLTERRMEARRKGGRAKHIQRLEKVEKIRTEALRDIKSISNKELWLIGIMLYWAEGTKEKEIHPGSGINFNNSDPRMIKVFVKWLNKSCGISEERIKFEIYIHENSKNDTESVRKFWSKVTGFSLDKFSKVYYKTNKVKTNRKNVGDLYYGLLRVRVSASSTLVRKIAGWTQAIADKIK